MEDGALAAGSATPGANWARPGVILVATDLSDQDRLMPLAFRMAAETSARLILLHVLPATAALTVDAVGMPYYDPAAAMNNASESLEPWCELAQKQNLCCDALVRNGNAAHEIFIAIRQFHADRVVLGTRSRSKLGKLFLGSVAEQVLRSVNLPVITVGPEAHLPVSGHGHPRVVLHATTLRETSRPSAALACQMAESQGAALVLLHVLPALDDMERKHLPATMDSAALHELRVLASETGSCCCTAVEAKVAHGNPAIEILAEAAARHASLIVLGATHRNAFENLTRDRTVYQVLAHARCPVVTLREPGAETPDAEPKQMAAHL